MRMMRHVTLDFTLQNEMFIIRIMIENKRNVYQIKVTLLILFSISLSLSIPDHLHTVSKLVLNLLILMFSNKISLPKINRFSLFTNMNMILIIISIWMNIREMAEERKKFRM